jgi:hypothetical protein
MKMIELKKAFGSMPFNGLIALILAAVIGAVSGCEDILHDEGKKTQEEKAKQDSIKVASTVRYGAPNVIITDPNGNPIPGPNGGSLRASDIPTNPNINFALRNSIADMAKTLGVECPDGKILYAILFGDKQAYLDFKSTNYSPYVVFDENDKSKGEWGTLIEQGCLVTEYSNAVVRKLRPLLGKWVDGRDAIFVQDNNPDEPVLVYINASNRVEIYDYGSEKLVGYLEEGNEPNTCRMTTYKYEEDHDHHDDGGDDDVDSGNQVRITTEEVSVGFIFIDQPEDDPSSVLAYTNSRGERTLANVMNSFDPKQRSKNNSLNTVY